MSLTTFYRALLRLLPASYREEDRVEMWETYAARIARSRSDGGRVAVLREQLSEVLDLAATIVSARWPFPCFDSVRQDAGTALRSLYRAPLASTLAITSLALGIARRRRSSACWTCG